MVIPLGAVCKFSIDVVLRPVGYIPHLFWRKKTREPAQNPHSIYTKVLSE